MKKAVTISLEEKLLEQLKKSAKEQHRTLTNLIELIIIEHQENKAKRN
jgi:predicted DNA-binding ribbon-helix-helix protein